MKKIVMMMLVLASMSVKVNAQWFVSGNAGIGYLADRFQLKLLPAAGYEFNDRWAVGFGLGMGVQRDYVFGIVAPYVRFNCWNNGKLFVDVKAKADVAFNDAVVADIGFAPSLRFAINDHWQVGGDFGLIGAQDADGDWSPAFGFTASGVDVSVIYRF